MFWNASIIITTNFRTRLINIIVKFSEFVQISFRLGNIIIFKSVKIHDNRVINI